jgi:preprotein translocase subunit YajC
MSLISSAFADEIPPAATSAVPNAQLMQLFPFVIIFFIFYFLLIKPQAKKQKEHANMIDSLKKGEKVVTTGGIVGTITKIEDTLFHLEISNDVVIKVLKTSIGEIFKPKALEENKK